MIAGLLCLLIANAGLTLAAWRGSRALATGRATADLLLFVLLRVLLISAAVLAFGLAGLLRPLPLAIAGAAALALFARKGALEGLPLRLPALHWGWKLLLGFLALRLAAQVWIFSPYVHDTLAYHLPKVAEWTRAGALGANLGPDPRSWFPSGFELVETWWTVFLHHDVLIELGGIEFLLLGACAAALLGETLGVHPFKAGLLYAIVPGIHLGATSCLNDGAAAAVVLTLFALVRIRAPWPLLLGILAFGVGIKPTVLYAAPGAVLLWGWERRTSEPPARLAAYLVLAAGLALGGFWYLRNVAIHGSPIYPMGQAGFLDDRGEQVQKVYPDPAGLLQSARALVRSRLNDLGAITPMLRYMAGWGAVAVSAGLVGLLLACRTRAEWRRLSTSFGLSVGVVLLMTVPDPWNLRFILFVPALLVSAALLLAEAWPVVRGLVVAGVCVQLLGTLVPEEFEVGAVEERLAMPWRARWSRVIPLDPWAAEVVAAGPSARRTYLLYRPDYSGRVVTIDAEDPDELVRRLRASGARLLHASPSRPVIRACVERKLLLPEPGPFFRLPP